MEASDGFPVTKPGLYEHHKGGKYRVICTAWESTNNRPRIEVVVYVSLSTGSVNVRTADEFNEELQDLNAPRFKYVGP